MKRKHHFRFVFVCIAFFTVSLLTLNTENSKAQNIIRGPYLQSPGPSSIIVRWRTDSLTDSRVSYGSAFASMTWTATDAADTTEHRVKITGLAPHTKYYYVIGSTTQVLKGPDSMLYFVTAPDTAAPTPVRFWAIGDFGHGSAGQQKVRDSYLRYAVNKPADLWLWLGDNAYQDGTDSNFQFKVFDTIYGYHDIMLHLPFAATSGNHDFNSICPWEPTTCMEHPDSISGPYMDIIDPPTEGEQGGVPSHRKLFYSFDYGDIHFISLCSELGSLDSSYNWIGLLNSDSSFTSPMLEWLKADIAATAKKWKIAFWHQCPYSGQNNFTESIQVYSIASREHFNPILEKFGVDLVLTGHDHNYQRSYMINGHYGYKNSFTSSMMINGTSGKDALGEPYIKYSYGPLKDKGTVYVVEGNSSSCNTYSPISHPAIYWGQACDTCYGSFIFEVNGNRLDGHYLTAYDEISDEFTIIKDNGSGIAEEGDNSKPFYIYPNPNKGVLNIEFPISDFKFQNSNLKIQNILGEIIYKSEIRNSKSKIDLGVLPQGVYALRVEVNGETVGMKRVVITR